MRNTLKSYILKGVFLAIALSIGLGGCAGTDRSETLAKIDGKDAITLNGFNERIANLPQRYQDVINKNKKEFLDELIIDELLYREALKMKIDKDSDVLKVLKEAKKKILIARLLKERVGDRVSVDEADIEEYYASNPERFTSPELLRASHILVKTQKEASDILVELSNGRDFEELARARSVDPSAKAGGAWSLGLKTMTGERSSLRARKEAKISASFAWLLVIWKAGVPISRSTE